MKPRRRAAQPKHGEALLDGLFRRLGLENQAREWRAIAAFHTAAGPHIAARVRAERMWGSTMVLRVANAAWANELQFMKADLLGRIHATPGGEWVTDLRFEPGPLDEAPSWEEPPKAPAPAAPSPPPVDDGEVAAALREVADPSLRAALAELFARARHHR